MWSTCICIIDIQMYFGIKSIDDECRRRDNFQEHSKQYQYCSKFLVQFVLFLVCLRYSFSSLWCFRCTAKYCCYQTLTNKDSYICRRHWNFAESFGVKNDIEFLSCRVHYVRYPMWECETVFKHANLDQKFVVHRKLLFPKDIVTRKVSVLKRKCHLEKATFCVLQISSPDLHA